MNEKTKPISATDAYAGTGSNEELWPILASHGAVTDPSDVDDSYLATVLINWRNAACKDVADLYQEAKARAEEAEAEVERLRGHLDAIGVAHRESVSARRALDAMREAEQEADVRVVAALLEAQEDGASMDECKHAFTELRARFAARIEAQEFRDAAAGGVRPNGDPFWEEQ